MREGKITKLCKTHTQAKPVAPRLWIEAPSRVNEWRFDPILGTISRINPPPHYSPGPSPHSTGIFYLTPSRPITQQSVTDHRQQLILCARNSLHINAHAPWHLYQHPYTLTVGWRALYIMSGMWKGVPHKAGTTVPLEVPTWTRAERGMCYPVPSCTQPSHKVKGGPIIGLEIISVRVKKLVCVEE